MPVGRPSYGLEDAIASIEKLLLSDKKTLADLAKVAGLSPASDFKNISLNGVPLTEQDISGFDFSGTDLRNTGVEKANGKSAARFTGAIFDPNLPSLDPTVIQLNKRLKDAKPNEAFKLLDDVRQKPAAVDVVSFTTVMARVRSDEAQREAVFGWLLQAGKKPNIFTFSTLINHATTEERREHWYQAMLAAGEKPNEITQSILEKPITAVRSIF